MQPCSAVASLLIPLVFVGVPPIGRSGGGPGEFLGAPQFTLLADDSVATFSAGRLSIFTPEGAFARSAQIRACDQVRGTLLGAVGASHVLFSDAPRSSGGGLRARDPIEVWRVHSASAGMSRAFIAPREPIPPPIVNVRRTSGGVRVQKQVIKPSRPYPAAHIVAGTGRVAIVEDSTWKITLRDFAGRALGEIVWPNAEPSRVRDALASGSLRDGKCSSTLTTAFGCRKCFRRLGVSHAGRSTD